MSAGRIYRYISGEVLIPALLSLLVLTFVLLMGRILRLVEMVINKGVPFVDIALLFAYLLPAFLVVTIPLSVLLGVLLGFGRLSADSETVAMKASGIGLLQMIRPVLAIALAASLTTGLLTLYAEPAGNAAFRSQVFEIASNRASVGIRPQVFIDDFDGLIIYAGEIDERTTVMQGVFISDERVGNAPAVILARHGRIISDPQALTLTLRLEDGTIHRQPTAADRDAYQIIEFMTYDVSLNMGEQLTPGDRPKKPKELTLNQLFEARREEPSEDKRRTYLAEVQKRLVLPLAPLILTLLGVPLGIQTQRSGRGGGFTIGLIVFLAYYVLFSFARTLSEEGGLPPVPTMWLPSIFFLFGGLYLLRQTTLEKRMVLLDRITEGPARLWQRFRSRGRNR